MAVSFEAGNNSRKLSEFIEDEDKDTTDDA